MDLFRWSTVDAKEMMRVISKRIRALTTAWVVLPGAAVCCLLAACAPTAGLPTATSLPASTLQSQPILAETPTQQTKPSTGTITSPEEAIAAVKARHAFLAGMVTAEPKSIGISQNIIVQPTNDGWQVIFWQGASDCEAGCLNNHYWYFSVEKNGQVAQKGEFERNYDPKLNDFVKKGTPLWGVPY